MNRSGRFGVTALVLLAVAAPIVAARLVHRDLPEAQAAAAPWIALALDSSRADSAAFASLPSGLMGLLDVRDEISAGVPSPLPFYECIQMNDRETEQLRRRLQLRLGDTSTAVLFAVADRATGRLDRVEFLRRRPRAGQRGFIWERTRDRTASSWWFETPRGLSSREERGDLPRGGPVPRALRALGRQLLTVPCADSSTNAPMNPISGSRN